MIVTFLQASYYRSYDTGSTFLSYIIVFIFASCVYSLIKGAGMLKVVLSHGHHPFDTVPFSPQELYIYVETMMQAKGITLSTSRVTYLQGGILSPRREYLRIQYKEFIYDICAAPFGKRYFVSWWLGESGNAFRDFFINLPVIGKLFTRRKKTFFELDTEIIFKQTVTDCLKEAISELTEGKGLRKLAAADWNEYNRQY